MHARPARAQRIGNFALVRGIRIRIQQAHGDRFDVRLLQRLDRTLETRPLERRDDSTVGRDALSDFAPQLPRHQRRGLRHERVESVRSYLARDFK